MHEHRLGLIGAAGHDPDDEYIIGLMSDDGRIGFVVCPKTSLAEVGGFFDVITKPFKAAVSLTTAPVRAAVDIAKGKPVLKTLARTMVTQPGSSAGDILPNPIGTM